MLIPEDQRQERLELVRTQQAELAASQPEPEIAVCFGGESMAAAVAQQAFARTQVEGEVEAVAEGGEEEA